MKTVGIMSMQKIKNYGSFLQAYGLKKIIEKLGYNVVFVDYSFEKSLVETSKSSFIDKVLKNINVINYIKRKKITNEYMNKFENELIPFLYKNNIEKDYSQDNIDYLVIGSDEVFNCLQPYPVGYSKELFGNNFEKIPVFSYAASFGQTDFNRLVEYGINNEISKMLSKFKSISVRDNNSYKTVNHLTNIKPSINLDPVLIYDFSDEMNSNFEIELKDYIIVYAYPGRISKEEANIIKRFAKNHNKKIVSFGMYQEFSDIEIVVHPFNIFKYFEKADFIITDTFHGSIFSIKTESKFCTLIRKNNNGNSNKLFDLLDRLDLKNRIIENLNDLEKYYNEKIDYERTNQIIKKEKNNTELYLKKCLDWKCTNE